MRRTSSKLDFTIKTMIILTLGVKFSTERGVYNLVSPLDTIKPSTMNSFEQQSPIWVNCNATHI